MKYKIKENQGENISFGGQNLRPHASFEKPSCFAKALKGVLQLFAPIHVFCTFHALNLST